jgi:two-component system response regulator PilR (NtrC family)
VAVESRIVCATNRDLDKLVEQGRFLDDLHHRLMGGVIEVPPLRRRSEDLRLLAGHLLDEVCALERTNRPEIAEDGWRLLIGHDWPGNVRELKALLHRAVALNPGVEELTANRILESAPRGSTLSGKRVSRTMPARDLTERLANTERQEILVALEKSDGVRRKAAEILGISYRGLGKKMVRLGIEGSRKKR